MIRLHAKILSLGLLAVGCDASYIIAHRDQADQGGTCGEANARCPSGTFCASGHCLPCEPGQPCGTPLEPLRDVHVDTRGTTAVVSFANVPSAVDYRIYPMPAPGSFHALPEGQVVDGAIYRCAGRRTVADRVDEYGSLFDYSLVGDYLGYSRTQDESELGWVYLEPGPDRVPVYRLADPNGNGGYHNADWIPPLYKEADSADYVVDPARRAQLLKQGFRDDGIAFYAPRSADRTVYRTEYAPETDHEGSRVSFFFTEGAEYAARTSASAFTVVDFGSRFSVRSAADEGAVLLHRVTYHTGSTFDVLAAGPADYARVLHQGGPVTSLTWSGLDAPTVLVIEALDAGCPFPGAYIGAFPVDVQPYPTRTLKQLGEQSPTGEVFVNGQFDPGNRPRPIARSFVEVSPAAGDAMDFHADLGNPADFQGMQVYEHPYAKVYRNDRWSVETTFCGDGLSYGPVLGQLFFGMSDCELSLVPRTFHPRIEAARFLHVRVATDLPSTARRFPQILVTSALPIEADAAASVLDIPIHRRAGSFVAAELPGKDSSVVVQPFFTYHEAQVQFCDHRGFGATLPCPRANLYGWNAGESMPRWPDETWRPVPVLTDLVGFDRPVQFDVYASTERVYLFADRQPVGCAALPAGRMPEGEVTVAYRAVVNQSSDDELIRGEPGRVFERAYSETHSDRRLDDFSMKQGAAAPEWDESRLPCAAKWFGGGLAE